MVPIIHCLSFAAIVSFRQTHGSELRGLKAYAYVNGYLLMTWAMGPGKTMSALARMLICTRDQPVELELELESKDEN